MNKKVVLLVRTKLAQSLASVDESTSDRIRSLWKAVGPAPTCPRLEVTVQQACDELVQGNVERGHVAREVVLETLIPLRSTLTQRLVDDILQTVSEAFSKDASLNLVLQTADVYNRRNAPTSSCEASGNTLSLLFASAQTSAANSSRQSVESVRIAVMELLIQKDAATSPRWRRGVAVFWSSAVKPSLKFFFGILSAVTVAVLTYLLVGK